MSRASSAIRRCSIILAGEIIPGLVRDQPVEQPLRIWIAGCSSGEETYSLAMLFREQIDAARSARSSCRYSPPTSIRTPWRPLARASIPTSIEADVSPERWRGFSSKEDRGYRVSPELRAMVVFTVQDVLADPPFSRLDLVSCRNLLIYLLPEAQAKVISLFHFALREGGLLLLGRRRDRRRSDGPVRGHLQAGAALPARRATADRENSVFARSSATASRLRAAARTGAARRARPRSPNFADGWCWRPMRPAAVLINAQARMSVFPGTRPIAISGRARAARP